MTHRYSGTLGDSAKNADVGISVHVDAVRIGLNLEHLANGIQESEVVNGITRIQQGTVDIEYADVGLLDELLGVSELVDGGHFASATIITSCVFYSLAIYSAVPDARSCGRSCTKWWSTTRSTW